MISSDNFGMLFRDYCYAYLGGVGKILSNTFKGVDRQLESACMNVHSEVYFSMISFYALLSSIIPLTILILSITNILPLQALFGINPILMIPLTIAVPGLVIMFGAVLPQKTEFGKLSVSRRRSFHNKSRVWYMPFCLQMFLQRRYWDEPDPDI